MTVTEALNKRNSIRAYLPTPIPAEVLNEVLAAAQRTPSWANTQPWEVFVAQGEALASIRRQFLKNAEEHIMPGAPDLERPGPWSDDAKRRTATIGASMARDCGEAMGQFGELNQKMYNAPAVVYLCVDKAHGHWSLYDIGAYSQSLMLAAIERGLGTIPAIMLCTYPEVLREELKIPDNLNIAIGIAIGYPDAANAINNLHTERDPLDVAVRVVG
ncbi:MAG: nitroreductase [Oscillospiraceae bacterium]|jgi:nitroreductase|nr:nitroreductase [Oscillospiraceae bacterium]